MEQEIYSEKIQNQRNEKEKMILEVEMGINESLKVFIKDLILEINKLKAAVLISKLEYAVLQDMDNIISYLSEAERIIPPEMSTELLNNHGDRVAFNQNIGKIALREKWNHFALIIGPDPLGGAWQFAVWFYLSETGLKSLPYFD